MCILEKANNYKLEVILRNKFDECFPKATTPQWVRQYAYTRFYVDPEKDALGLKVFIKKNGYMEHPSWKSSCSNSDNLEESYVEKNNRNIYVSCKDHINLYIFEAIITFDNESTILNQYEDLESLYQEDFFV